MILKQKQAEVFNNLARFVVLISGRRWAKTTTALLKVFSKACEEPGLYGYFAPTYKNAKMVAWGILKNLIPRNYVRKTNESELWLELLNGSVIRLFGVDRAEGLRGIKLRFGIGDEFDQWKTGVYEAVIRPALSDSSGGFWFIGSPDATKRRLRDKYEEAKIMEREQGARSEWKAFKFRSIDGGYIPQEEIETAKRELDERTFRQEYEASFEDILGQVYYSFDIEGNCVAKDHFGQGVDYNPRLPLRVHWDFNVDPFCVTFGHGIHRVDEFRNNFQDVHVFDELVIRNSNTPEMCKAILERFRGHKAGVIIYGDAAGQARHTNAAFSDYQIIIDHFRNMPGFTTRIKQANPRVKDRINAVNAKLKAYDGKRHLFIHPRCKKLIKDFMNVTYKEGTVDLDKSDLETTHLTDGLGYGIDYDFPVVKGFIN